MFEYFLAFLQPFRGVDRRADRATEENGSEVGGVCEAGGGGLSQSALTSGEKIPVIPGFLLK